MKIAMISEHANPLAALGGADAGGQNVHVAALADHLVRRGHDVTVFTRRDEPSLPARLVTTAGYVVEHVPAGPPSDVPKDELLGYMPAFADYLRARLGRDPVDLLHAHFWMSGLASLAAATPLALPVVQTFHALGIVKRRHQGSKDTSPRARIRIEQRLCSEVDHIIATCTDEIQELTRLGLDPGRASVVPCGVDLPPRLPRRGDDRPFRLLVLGRIVERKGVGNVITALPALPQAQLVVAGGPSADALAIDPEVCRLRQLAQDNGTGDRVHFLGRVSHGDVSGLIQSCDVVVAVPWYEPFGIVPVEAMANGRPVVGTAVGGLLDTVVPGETGELVPPRRPDVLAETLRRLLADPARCRRYGEAGYRRAASTYRWEQVAAKTESVYASVLSRAVRTTEGAIR